MSFNAEEFLNAYCEAFECEPRENHCMDFDTQWGITFSEKEKELPMDCLRLSKNITKEQAKKICDILLGSFEK